MKKAIAIILTFLLILTSCSNGQVLNESSLQPDEAVVNLFVPSEGDILYGAYYLYSDDYIYISNNDVVEIPICVDNITDEISVGFLAFLDGAIQEVKIEGCKKGNRYMPEIAIGANTSEHLTLQLSPEYEDGNEFLSLRVLVMLNPSNSYEMVSLHYGNSHSAMQIGSSQNVNVNKDAKIEPIVFRSISANNYEDINEEEFQITKADIQYAPYAFLYGDELFQPTLFSKNKSYTFKFLDSQEQIYRTTFFVNHYPQKFNNGFEFLEFTTRSDQAVSEKIVFDGKIPDGSFAYSISIPMNPDNYNIVKTHSQLLEVES